MRAHRGPQDLRGTVNLARRRELGFCCEDIRPYAVGLTLKHNGAQGTVVVGGPLKAA